MRKEDKCRIEVCGEMTMDSYASFTMLYLPLIGNDAAILYHTLVSVGSRTPKIKNHILIQKISRLSMENMEKSRHVLEQYLLVKTFYDAAENRYLYKVFMPKDGNDFLRHEVFGRLYMKEMGKEVYEFHKQCFSKPYEDKSTYQEITIPFVNVIKEDWQDTQEDAFRKLKPKQNSLYQNDIPLSFNYDRFLNGLSQIVFPSTARSEKNLRIIGELATIHGIDEITMRKLVSKSMDLKTNDLDVERLKRKVRNTKPTVSIKENKDPYQLPPVAFLQNLQHGVKVSRSDSYLIETLISEYKMKPEVVNVLIEYVLKTKNQQFPKAYVEKVASTWVRLGIDTSEKALAQIKEETNKPVKTKNTNKQELPSWYQNPDEIKVDVDDFNEEELLKDLEVLRGE